MKQYMRLLTLSAVVTASAFTSMLADVANAGVVISYVSRAPNQSVGNVGSVTLDLGANQSTTVKLNQGGGFFFQEAGDGTIAAAGLDTVDGLLLAFCIELTQTFSTSATMTYDVIDLKDAPKPDSGNLVGGMGTVKAEKLGLLWSFAIEDALTSAANSSAFQLAIWMIQYGEDLTYSSVNSSIKTMAESWVYTVDSIHGTDGYEVFVADVVALSSGTHQDFITVTVPGEPDPGPNLVPEPSSLAAWLLLAAAVGIGMRRRRSV